MAGYVSIETIVPCRDVETLHEIGQHYLQTLVALGIGEPTLFSWGQNLRWPNLGEQIETEWAHMRGEASGESFEITLTVLLWGDEKEWEHVSLELLFDIEEAIGPGAPFHPDLIWYTRPFGRLAWRIMQAVSAQVLGYGCYLGDEATDTEILKLIDEEPGHFWWPSLAIVPRKFYKRFLPVSDQTAVKRQDEIGIFANKAHWEILPWEE
jgi:hypothetical protein